MRVGVGRPDSTDPEIVSAHVLSRFTEPPAEVRRLIERAADETERLLEREYAASETDSLTIAGKIGRPSASGGCQQGTQPPGGFANGFRR